MSHDPPRCGIMYLYAHSPVLFCIAGLCKEPLYSFLCVSCSEEWDVSVCLCVCGWPRHVCVCVCEWVCACVSECVRVCVFIWRRYVLCVCLYMGVATIRGGRVCEKAWSRSSFPPFVLLTCQLLWKLGVFLCMCVCVWLRHLLCVCVCVATIRKGGVTEKVLSLFLGICLRQEVMSWSCRGPVFIECNLHLWCHDSPPAPLPSPMKDSFMPQVNVCVERGQGVALQLHLKWIGLKWICRVSMKSRINESYLLCLY